MHGRYGGALWHVTLEFRPDIASNRMRLAGHSTAMGDATVSHLRSVHLKSACGVVVALVGLSALAGWETGQRLLSGIRSDYIPMAPNTAIGFLLLGIALVAMPGDTGRLWRKVVAVGAAGFVAGLAGFQAGRICAFRSTWAFTTGSFRSLPSGSGWHPSAGWPSSRR